MCFAPLAVPACPQVLFRVALALLKLHEPALLAQDNPGELLRAARRAAAEAYDRDLLMKVWRAAGLLLVLVLVLLNAAVVAAVHALGAAAVRRRWQRRRQPLHPAHCFDGYGWLTLAQHCCLPRAPADCV